MADCDAATERDPQEFAGELLACTPCWVRKPGVGARYTTGPILTTPSWLRAWTAPHQRSCDSVQQSTNHQQYSPLPAAFFDRGNIAMRLERYDQALSDFRTAANLAPGLAGYRLREATLLYQQGEPEEAKAMMRGIVRKNPRYAGAPSFP